MSKCTKEEHNALRERLTPAPHEHYCQPEKVTLDALELKSKLDNHRDLKELERIQKDYIDL
jgi:hypothetical protein